MNSKYFTQAFLRATPGPVRNAQGLILFRLGLWVNRKEVAKLTAVSGQAYAQTLVKSGKRQAGSYMPIGEGVYRLGDPDAQRRLNWASGHANDFSGSWGRGLGPLWVGIHATDDYPCNTLDYGIHADWNEEDSPGSAGCLTLQGPKGPRDLARLKTLASWFAKYDIPYLHVDYRLGSVQKP